MNLTGWQKREVRDANTYSLAVRSAFASISGCSSQQVESIGKDTTLNIISGENSESNITFPGKGMRNCLLRKMGLARSAKKFRTGRNFPSIMTISAARNLDTHAENVSVDYCASDAIGL